MSNPVRINKTKTLEKWMIRICDSHEICPYCGKRKKDYICPNTGRLFSLKSECEKKLDNFIEAKAGITQSQFNTRGGAALNDEKLPANDRRYIADSEKALAEINQSIYVMTNIKNRRAQENYGGY